MMMKFYIILLFFIAFLHINSQNSCAEAYELTQFGLYEVEGIDGNPASTNCVSGNFDASHAEWYSYTPAENMTLQITTDLTQNIGGDTRVSVFSGSCDNLICVAGDDDGGELGNGYLSLLNAELLGGNTYLIVFDNKWSSAGFDFEISEGQTTISPLNFTLTNFNSPAIYNKAVSDMNGDFLDDIIGINEDNIWIYYQQADNTFSHTVYYTPDVLHLPSWSVTIGDIDANGKNDILMGSGSGVSFLYANDNGSTYTPVNFYEYIFSQRANFVDINNDGDLDAFVCHDLEPNVYFLNDGDGEFTFHQGGLGDDEEGGDYGSVWTDYDNDGDLDLFIAKCRGGNIEVSKDELHRNNGDGTFTEVGLQANLQDTIQSWSSAWGDFNNDGWMDVMVGANSFSTGMHKLKINDGNGYFVDATIGSGIEQLTSGSRDFVTFDFDNNGYLDIFSRINGGSILLNDGNMHFTENENAVPFGSVGDLNNDGFLDVFADGNIWLNTTNENNWLVVNTEGLNCNRNGIGARVEIHGEWGVQIREVRSGEGFTNMNTLNTHFGLGSYSMVNLLRIRWPNGVIDEYYNIEANQIIKLTEGETLAIEEIEDPNNSTLIVKQPVGNTLEIRTDKHISKIKLFSIVGEHLMDFTTESTEVAHLIPGKYYIQIHFENNEIKTLGFIKE